MSGRGIESKIDSISDPYLRGPHSDRAAIGRRSPGATAPPDPAGTGTGRNGDARVENAETAEGGTDCPRPRGGVQVIVGRGFIPMCRRLPPDRFAPSSR
jgi:hypothetical protein